MASADRLQAIQDDYTSALEARITDLMATVHAARELNGQIADADAQIEMGQADADALAEELSGIPADTDDHVAGTEQLEGLRQAIADTQAYRDEMVDALGKLVGEIGG